MAIQDDSLILLQTIADASDGAAAPVVLEAIPELGMDVADAKAAFQYLKSKGLIDTFSIPYSARLTAAGHDLLAAQASYDAKPPTYLATVPPEQGEILMLKPNFYGIGLDLNELFRRVGRWLGSSSAPTKTLVLLPDEGRSFAHHAIQPDGRKLTQIALHGWATNTSEVSVYPNLVRISRPLRLKATSNFILTQGDSNIFGRDNPVQPGERREVSAHFFVEGLVGQARRPLRVVVKVCDNLGHWHPWVFPAVPNR